MPLRHCHIASITSSVARALRWYYCHYATLLHWPLLWEMTWHYATFCRLRRVREAATLLPPLITPYYDIHTFSCRRWLRHYDCHYAVAAIVYHAILMYVAIDIAIIIIAIIFASSHDALPHRIVMSRHTLLRWLSLSLHVIATHTR